MQELRQSTEVKVRIGSAVDATDGVTPETGLTLGAADQAELLKHNGAATMDISASTFAAVTAVDGWYDLTLTAGNTDTLGQITVAIQDSSLMVPIFRDFMVVTANYWDSKYSTDVRHADVTQIGGVAQSATDLKDFADAGYDPATNKVQGVVLTDACTALTGHTAQTGDSFARIGAAGVSLTDLGGMSIGMKAEVQTEANDALIAQNLDHLVKIAVDTNWATTVHLDSVLGHIADVGTAATFSRTTDALEAIRDRGDAAWSAAAGNPSVLIDTTIATLATQTSFTLTAGSDIDDAYKDQAIVLYDASNNDYPSVRKVSAYTGATKTVTLDSAPDFTAVPGDGVKTFVTAPGTTAPTVGQIRAEMEGAGYKLALIEADVSAIDVLTEGGGSGDLAAIKTQVDAILDLERESGVVTVTEVETTLYEDAAPTKNKLGVVVKIDMAALEAADTFVVKEKYKDESGGAYQVVDVVSYTGVQTNPLRIIALTPYRYGAIITMQRTAGTNRSIEWESFVEE